jgi:Family of unknown function (DUF6159)
MFERISNSFALARSRWDVLQRDKKFIVFPIVSGLGCLLVSISFAVPTAIVALRGGVPLHAHAQPPWWTYVVAFAFYFCNYFVIVFCNSALISCALLRFAGEEATLSDGSNAAAARLPQIFAWALVSATVGVLLKVIENSHERAGQFISAILGTAWTVVTFFVVPVLVVEKVGPFEAIRRSLELLRRTWGEALTGHWGIGFFTFLLILPGILVLALGIAVATVVPLAGVGIIVLAVVYLLICGVISSTLNTIFLAALYQYASFKTVPVGFDRQVIEGAFQPKR